MSRFNSLIVLIVILVITSCGKSKNEINPLILGEWQLIEIYGVKADNSTGWMTIPASPVQTIKFNSNGKYTLATDGIPTCNGNFVFEGDSNIKLVPDSCMPLIESLETIYTLTQDTLTISNKSISISSYNLRRDKYIRIN
jgi:hypothetical protein